MARVRKVQASLETTFFSSPEQKVIRLLLSEPTTAFTPRVISSKLKGVRGLGGSEGIMRVLTDFQTLGLVDFVDNHRAVRIREDSTCVRILKMFVAICNLESLKNHLEPFSSRGVLYGNWANGKATSDCSFDLFVVSAVPEEVKKVASRHPLGKDIQLLVFTPESYGEIGRQDPGLNDKLSLGITLWGSTW